MSNPLNLQRMKKIFIIAATTLLSMPLYAQDVQNVSQKTDTTIVAPIESSRLQGTREATEAEKEYARRLSEAREEQKQIDNNLPMVDEYGQTITPNNFDYPYWNYGWTAGPWRLHKGLNVNLGASVFSNFGRGTHHGAGFTQDVSLMYVTNLSKKATLAVGGYLTNTIYGGSNYTVAGVNALFGYQFDEHCSAYAFVQKAFTSNNCTPWSMGYGTFNNRFGGWGMGFAPMYAGWGMGMAASRYMDRIGAGVTYQWGERKQNAVSISFEYDHLPNQQGNFYDFNRYSYPVGY